ncbi:NAD-dependent epimerase/dehydratase family protein [Candidatus Uabimicrobium amorphum]|uniref:Oxidoreductase n=1 Tax=Uabimicrobium amorphum TaxID=2596890 RepID=A0A5S9IU82_UABAM|nr:NAD-dependent epimerase/dehydratase family protein [Candidatus Uabimicrobium amorphum]BBM88034.1 oxidoreductase [Candidatus Uabimicrobium amorphum]
MKILVTGATGFIGGRTVEALLSLSYDEVRCCGRNRSKAEHLEKKGACFHEGSLLDDKHVNEITRDIDMIVHCAGLAGTWGKYEDYHEANVTATEKLVAAAQKSGVQRFVNISSPSIYFDYRDQLDLVEGDLPKKFSNHYATTKFKAEKVVEKAHNEKFLTVSLRPRFVIGAGDNQILPRLIRLQKSNMLVQIGDGENIVDVTTVKNVVDAILLCLKAPHDAMGEVYNISNGEPVKFWKFVDMVLTKMGISTERKKVPYRLMLRLARVNQMVAICVKRKEEPRLLPITVAALAKSMTLNIAKAREKLGYDPQQTVEEGVDEFLAWWREKKS